MLLFRHSGQKVDEMPFLSASWTCESFGFLADTCLPLHQARIHEAPMLEGRERHQSRQSMKIFLARALETVHCALHYPIEMEEGIGKPIFVVGRLDLEPVSYWCIPEHPTFFTGRIKWLEPFAVDAAVGYQRGSERGKRSDSSAQISSSAKSFSNVLVKPLTS